MLVTCEFIPSNFGHIYLNASVKREAMTCTETQIKRGVSPVFGGEAYIC